MHRFYLQQQDFIDDRVFIIKSGELVHQWKNVLRFHTGEKVMLFDGSGYNFIVEILTLTSKIAEGKVISKYLSNTELPIRVLLAQSILKNMDKFELVLQKGTELGVSEFYPLITRRTERESLHKIDRLQRILVEATEQCGRSVVPVLHEPIKFESFLKLEFVARGQVTFLMPHVVADGRIADFELNPEKRVAVCIGPEGGFVDQEIEAAKQANAFMVTLGKRVLRSETASLATVTLLASRIEGF